MPIVVTVLVGVCYIVYLLLWLLALLLSYRARADRAEQRRMAAKGIRTREEFIRKTSRFTLRHTLGRGTA
jgi:hypothetical protein